MKATGSPRGARVGARLRRRRLWLGLCVAALCVCWSGAVAFAGITDLPEVREAITALDVERARRLLDGIVLDLPQVGFERARLALYVGDCDTAAAIAAPFGEATSAAPGGDPFAGELPRVAASCARAVAGARILSDTGAGVWLRLQSEEDRVLAPFVIETAARARDAIERDLGVRLPKPLRIDLVRDLFSLAAVSGLPVDAAETTGTLGVARWGRITLLSPRATSQGYAWQDTLAHEIAHLVITRGTIDRAPLWLQEGLAKREETRWRTRRPGDGQPPSDEVARAALTTGQSVGVTGLGPSIAMLPTPQAAAIAFAEVSSFVAFFVERMGGAGLRLLLADLAGLRPERQGEEVVEAALRSVSGYDLAGWTLLWQQHLVRGEGAAGGAPKADLGVLPGVEQPGVSEARRRARLADLLFEVGHLAASRAQADEGLRPGPAAPALAWRAGRAALAAGEAASARRYVERPEGALQVHAGWWALSGRLRRHSGLASDAGRAFELALAANPYLEDAACEGYCSVRQLDGTLRPPEAMPQEGTRRALCEAAGKLPRE